MRVEQSLLRVVWDIEFLSDLSGLIWDASIDKVLFLDVGEGWCCHLADKATLVLFVPSQELSSSTLSREHFVELLEQCEEKMNCKRVLACFNKSDINPRQGIPRALKCIGFTLLHPNDYPAGIDKNSIFAMVYNI